MGFDIINKFKKQKGWTNEDLSNASGVPKATIDKITAGTTTNPNFDTVWALAEALECTVDQFKEVKLIDLPMESEATDERLTDIIDIYNDMNEEGRDKLETYANDLIGNPRHKKESQFRLGSKEA